MELLTSHTAEILHALRDAVLVVNHHGKILFVNEAGEQLFGRSRDELMNQVFGFPIVQQAVQEISVIRKGRPVTAQMLAAPINWNGKAASVLSIRDITEQKATQEALAEQSRLLTIRSEENAQFASLASHDLKEPLRKIDTFSEMLVTSGELSKMSLDRLGRIQQAVQRMRRLIDGIAELSQFPENRSTFTQLNLHEIIQTVTADLKDRLQEKGALVRVGKFPLIDGQADKLYQLFLNLIGNALKFVHVGRSPEINVTGERVADKLIIHVRDNGIGFDNKYARQLFLPFKRLHSRKYEGMGVGLSICQRIVELHHGEIIAEGELGQGAHFIISLPIHQYSPPLKAL